MRVDSGLLHPTSRIPFPARTVVDPPALLHHGYPGVRPASVQAVWCQSVAYRLLHLLPVPGPPADRAVVVREPAPLLPLRDHVALVREMKLCGAVFQVASVIPLQGSCPSGYARSAVSVETQILRHCLQTPQCRLLSDARWPPSSAPRFDCTACIAPSLASREDGAAASPSQARALSSLTPAVVAAMQYLLPRLWLPRRLRAC